MSPEPPDQSRHAVMTRAALTIQSNVWSTAAVGWQADIARRSMDEAVSELLAALHSPPVTTKGLGDAVIGEIAKQGMIQVSHPDPAAVHVFVWAHNAAEQLECFVRDFQSGNNKP